MAAVIAAAGLFEIAALGLENVQLRRHPMDYLIARLDAHAVNAEVVVMGDSVTKSVVDWYDVGPSIANLTDNRSGGVIGMRIGKDDEVISMSVLKHVDLDAEERGRYLRAASARQRIASSALNDAERKVEETKDAEIAGERFDELAAAEEFILSVT